MNTTLQERRPTGRAEVSIASFSEVGSTHFLCPNCSSEKFELNSIVLKFHNTQKSNQIELLPMSRAEINSLASFFAVGANLSKPMYLDHIPGIRIYLSSDVKSPRYRKLQIIVDGIMFYQVNVEAKQLSEIAVAVGQVGKICRESPNNLVLAA